VKRPRVDTLRSNGADGDSSSGSAVKRSITIRRDVDASIRHAIGDGQYSAFINDAAILALQTQAITEWLTEFEAQNGEITDEELNLAHERLRDGVSAKKASGVL